MTIGADDAQAVQALTSIDPSVQGLQLAVSEDNQAALRREIAKHDIVLSLVPAALHPPVAQACIAAKKHFVTASYISPQLKALDDEAKRAGIAMFNEVRPYPLPCSTDDDWTEQLLNCMSLCVDVCVFVWG